MMEEKKMVPNRRFREFKNKPHWKQSSLKEVVDVYDGTYQTPRYTDSGIMFLSVENIHSLRSNKYISHEDFKRDFKVYPEEGDVLMTRIGDIGTANVVETNEEKAYYVTLALLKKKGMDPYFLKENIHSPSVKRELRHRTLHIAFPKKINMDEIGKILINYPCNLEQQKIGEFFKVLDQRIANQERKITKVKALKSAYLNEMLPQKGENVPKRRFNGYTEKWNYCLLKEVINSEFKGKAKAEMQGGNSPYLDTNYLNGGEISYVNLPNDVEKDDVLILWDGSQAGMVYHGFEGALGSTLKAYKPKYSGEFLYQFLKKNQKVIFEQYRTPNIPHVINTFVDEFWICMPSIEEQQKIGQFFKNLDDQITTEEKKLEKLKKMKEAYLEEMFV